MTYRSVVLFWAVCAAAAAADSGSLRAGAARVDITPAPGAALPLSGYADRTQGHQGVHDRLQLRALVINDGTAQAGIVVWELIGVPNAVWKELAPRLSKETGIPVENLLIAGVHTHGAPALKGGYSEVPPQSIEYTARVQDAAVQALKQAQARLQPARVGFGTGQAHINVNRRELMPSGLWWLGYNPGFPSDKTVAVVKFETPAGEPIALLANYPVHAVTMGGRNLQITGDLAGATSRFVEERYKDKALVLWTSGAAGDQNPVSRSPGSDFTLVDAYGQILGEEVLRVAGAIRTSAAARIRGAQRVVTCPGRRVEPGKRPRKDYVFSDADPVDIRLSLLMIGNVAVTGVSGEVLVRIGQRLKSESPYQRVFMVTHANGSSGYIPDDAAFDQVGYEITTSRLKPGCAEKAIVDGLVSMM